MNPLPRFGPRLLFWPLLHIALSGALAHGWLAAARAAETCGVDPKVEAKASARSTATAHATAGSATTGTADVAKKEAAKIATEEGDLVGSFDGLDVTSTGKSTLVTMPIARVFSPINFATPNAFYSALGFDISASLPVENAEFVDYARHQLLMRDAGVVNFYVSFTGREQDPSKCELTAFRRGFVNRAYLNRQTTDASNALFFVSHAIGARVLKTELPGDAMAGLLTAYVGVGLDGPLFDGQKPMQTRTAAGLYSLELYGSFNSTNKRTLGKMFAVEGAPKSFSTAGIKFHFNLPGNFNLQLQYSKGLGSFGRSALGDLVLMTFGYKKDEAPPAGQ